MTRYAERTSVSVEKTQAEIQRLVEQKYGARGYMAGRYDERVVVQFEMEGRRVRFMLSLPEYDADEYGSKAAWEQEKRSLWRGLLLAIKAKLTSFDNGIETFEEAFAAQLVIPATDQTVGEWLLPQIDDAYRTGQMPPMLPGTTSPILLPPAREHP